jgi:hypothetical protein
MFVDRFLLQMQVCMYNEVVKCRSVLTSCGRPGEDRLPTTDHAVFITHGFSHVDTLLENSLKAEKNILRPKSTAVRLNALESIIITQTYWLIEESSPTIRPFVQLANFLQCMDIQ